MSLPQIQAVTDAEEDANVLEFGKVIDDETMPMTFDEVYYYLQKMSKGGSIQQHEVFDQTSEYLSRVVSSTDEAVLDFIFTDIRDKLQSLTLKKKDGKSRKLHSFEIAQLANLVSDDSVTVEEITSLILSLNEFHEDQVQQCLEMVANAKEKAQGM